MEIRIRPFEDKDAQFVKDLHKLIYAGEYLWGTAFTDYVDEIVENYVREEDGPGRFFLIAESEGVPVGSVMVCPADEDHTGQLRLFAVAKEYRRNGTGRMLMEKAMKMAGGEGYLRMILWTADPLVDAIRIYESFGFRETERVPNETWRLDGGTVYEIKMEMSLVSSCDDQ